MVTSPPSAAASFIWPWLLLLLSSVFWHKASDIFSKHLLQQTKNFTSSSFHRHTRDLKDAPETQKLIKFVAAWLNTLLLFFWYAFVACRIRLRGQVVLAYPRQNVDTKNRKTQRLKESRRREQIEKDENREKEKRTARGVRSTNHINLKSPFVLSLSSLLL